MQLAVRVEPVPASGTAPQPATVVVPSMKATVPVGKLPVTVAVMVTLPAVIDGLGVTVNAVVEAVAPGAIAVTSLDSALSRFPLSRAVTAK